MDVSLILMALVILLVLVALGYFVMIQVRNSAEYDSRKGDTSTASAQGRVKNSKAPELPPYRATSIRPGKNACEAALAVVDKRHLVEDGEIPPLPLPACDAASCNCKYVKYVDRREEEDEDRRDIVGINRNMGALDREEERRSGRERRKSTLLEWRDN